MTSFRSHWAKAGAIALVLAACMGVAHAGGTQAGTSITNSATLQYKIGNVDQNAICSSEAGKKDSVNCAAAATAFTVDNKIDVLVTAKDSAPVPAVPGGSAYVKFDVKNQGNLAQIFTLSSFNAGNVTLGSTGYTDNVDPLSCVIQDDTGTAVSNNRITLAIDQSKTYRVSCTFDTTKTGNAAFTLTDYAVVGLKATATDSSSNPLTESTTNTQAGTADILFADGKGPYTGDDSLRDAAYSDRSAFNMKPAVLTVSKTMTTICDPVTGDTSNGNQPRNIPDAIVKYTITVSNAASASTATLSTISDTLVNELKFDNNFVTGANVSSTVFTKCSSANGTATFGPGKGVRAIVTGSSRTTTYPKYLDSSAVVTGQAVSFNGTTAWPTVLPIEGATYGLGDLKAGETLTLEFNVTVQ